MFKKIATMIALTFAISNTAMASSEFNPNARIASAEAASNASAMREAPAGVAPSTGSPEDAPPLTT